MFSPFCLSVLTLWSVLPGLIIYFIPKCASRCWDSMDCMGMSQPLEMNKSFTEAPTCCVCTWRAERGCVGVYPPGPRAAVENHRDICVNFLFLACFIFFFFFLFFSGCLVTLSWFTACAHVALERGVLKLFCFQKEKKLAGIHISVLELCRLKPPSGKREDTREQIAGGNHRRKREKRSTEF